MHNKLSLSISFIHCVDYPNVVLSPVSLFHEDEVREERLRISNIYKKIQIAENEYDSVLFNSTIAESIQINGKHVYCGFMSEYWY